MREKRNPASGDYLSERLNGFGKLYINQKISKVLKRFTFQKPYRNISFCGFKNPIGVFLETIRKSEDFRGFENLKN